MNTKSKKTTIINTLSNKPSTMKNSHFLTKYNLTNYEMCTLIEDGLVDYLKIVSENGRRPFVLNEKIGWVKTFPTAWSNYIFYSNFDIEDVDNQISQVISKIKAEELPCEWVVGPKSKGVASIDMVSTLRKYWHMGIGTAMTKIPLLYAKDKGYKIGVLQASEAGEHGYRKIGFQEYCRFNVYTYQK